MQQFLIALTRNYEYREMGFNCYVRDKIMQNTQNLIIEKHPSNFAHRRRVSLISNLNDPRSNYPSRRLKAKTTINQRQSNDLTIETITQPRFDFVRANYANANLVEEILRLPGYRLSPAGN